MSTASAVRMSWPTRAAIPRPERASAAARLALADHVEGTTSISLRSIILRELAANIIAHRGHTSTAPGTMMIHQARKERGPAEGSEALTGGYQHPALSIHHFLWRSPLLAAIMALLSIQEMFV